MVQTRPAPASPEEPPDAADVPFDGERHDVRSLGFALGGTFVLRCASYAAGLIIPVSLGLKSRTDSEITAVYASLIGVAFYSADSSVAHLRRPCQIASSKPFMLLGPIFGASPSIVGITAIIRCSSWCASWKAFDGQFGALDVVLYPAQTAGSQRLRAASWASTKRPRRGSASGAAVGGRLYEHFGAGPFR